MDIKERYEAYEKANRINQIADAETAKRLGIEVGEEYSIFPPPETSEKAWEKLNEHTSLIYLESFIKAFKRNLPINLRTLNDELSELQSFIDTSETYSTKIAFSANISGSPLHFNFEYLKLKYDYYKNAEYREYNFFPQSAEYVYSKYFVYKKWIEDNIKELTPVPKVFRENPYELHNEVIDKMEAELEISIFEILKRELNSYHWIFKSQFSKQSTKIEYPMIHNDGVYCPSIEIYSNSELSKLERYKQHYIKRFEKGKRKTAVENELLEIYKKAVYVRNYFNENLTNENPIVAEIAKSFVDLTNLERFHMQVIIERYNTVDIYFNQKMNQDFNDYSRRRFHYVIHNRTLAEFCQNLIDFIDNFEIDRVIDWYSKEFKVVNFKEVERSKSDIGSADIKSDEGKQIFDKFHNYYKEQITKSKNYSFLWYAFKKNNYTDLTQTKWIDFLRTQDVKISFTQRYNYFHKEVETVKQTFLEIQKKVQDNLKTPQTNSDSLQTTSDNPTEI